MPELPEVETVCRTLEGMIAGCRIEEIEIRYPKMIECGCEKFVSRLKGRSFQKFARRGKYLLFEMEDVILVSHLRMEGKYYVVDPSMPTDRHTHVIFALSDGRQLRYHDTRKFGRMDLLEKGTDLTHFHDLGPEPFDEMFNGSYVYESLKKRKAPLKSCLLDQTFTAGIGNIYADEILSACGLRPGRSASRITRKNADDIAAKTKEILAAAIAKGGTTIRSYTSSLGVTGLFQLSCSVHGKTECAVCGCPVKVRRIGGRSSYYCPVHQK